MKNSNDADLDTEEVNLDDNYDHLLQLRVDKNVIEVRLKQKLKVVIPERHKEPSRETKTHRSASSHVWKIRIVSGERT